MLDRASGSWYLKPLEVQRVPYPSLKWESARVAQWIDIRQLHKVQSTDLGGSKKSSLWCIQQRGRKALAALGPFLFCEHRHSALIQVWATVQIIVLKLQAMQRQNSQIADARFACVSHCSDIKAQANFDRGPRKPYENRTMRVQVCLCRVVEKGYFFETTLKLWKPEESQDILSFTVWYSWILVPFLWKLISDLGIDGFSPSCISLFLFVT